MAVLAALSLLGLLVLVAVARTPAVRLPLLTAAGVRLALGLIGLYAIVLPYGDADARVFERRAWRIAQQGWSGIASAANPLSSAGFEVVSIWAGIYRLAGREPALLLAYNIVLSTATVYVVFLLVQALAGKRKGNLAAYALALCPTVVLMSSVLLREAAVTFGITVGVFGLIQAMRTHRATMWWTAVGGMAFATLHHGGVFFPFLCAMLWMAFQLARQSFTLKGVRLRSLMILFLTALLFFGGSVFVAPSDINLNSVGFLRMEELSEEVLNPQARRAEGGSGYYGGVATESWSQAIRQFPGRLGLFLLSPLPWTVRTTGQVVALVDVLLWLGSLLFLWRRRRSVWKDPWVRVLFVFFFVGISVFALGTVNAGTALRHRAKFFPILIALVFASSRSREASEDVAQPPAAMPATSLP